MESTMELDDFKQAWQTLDRRLERQNEINLRLYTEGKLEKARAGLRPLFWGQIAQLLFGLLVLVAAVAFWTLPVPRESPLLLTAGVVMHAYGVVVIVVSGITLGMAQNLDYTAPVVAIQKQLLRLRRAYIISGMVAGLPWWLLWMLPLLMLAGWSGDAGAMAWLQSFLPIGIGIGVAGLLGTWWFHRWSQHPSRPRLAKAMEDGLSGSSLRRAQRLLDELAQFERE